MTDTAEFQPCPYCVRAALVITTVPPRYEWRCIVCSGGTTTTDVEFAPPPPRIEDLRPAPTIGRIVHYTEVPTLSERTLPLTVVPAIITAVRQDDADDSVSLQIFGLEAVVALKDCPRADEPTEGHWHWPTTGPAFLLKAGS